MSTTLFQETVENLKKLDYEEKVYIRDICERMLEDESRSEFIANIREGQAESRGRKLKKYADLNDLRAALHAD
jgi:hypothetical protein